MRNPLLLVAMMTAASVLPPTAQAHGAPEILDNEVVLLIDEGSDDMYVYDGFDLQYLYIREAHLQDTDGLVFRIAITNGPYQPGWGPYLIEFDLTVNGTEHTLGFTSDDGTGWTGEHEVLEENVDTIEGGIVEIDFQAFVPLAALDAEDAEEISVPTMRSYAKEDLIDEVPGGYYLPGTGRNVELTHWGVGEVAQDTYILDGPTDYTNTTFEDGTLHVESLITVSGQHVVVSFGEAAGWMLVQSGTTQEVGAGAALDLEPGILDIGDGALPVRVWTDLGGLETGFIEDHGGLVWVDEATPQASEDGTEDAPAAALTLMVTALLALAIRRRD